MKEASAVEELLIKIVEGENCEYLVTLMARGHSNEEILSMMLKKLGEQQ